MKFSIVPYDEQQHMIVSVIETSDIISIILPNARYSAKSFAIYTEPATIPAGAMNTDNKIISARFEPAMRLSPAAPQRGHESEPSGSGYEQLPQYRMDTIPPASLYHIHCFTAKRMCV